MTNRLIIVGASARAAAESAARAGYRVTAADLFCDTDLRRCATAVRVANFDQLPATLATLPPARWCYTGGLENRPDLITMISRWHHLLGCDARVLRTTRCPDSLNRILRAANIAYPEVQQTIAACDREDWLCKPIRGCGGHGVCRVRHRPTRQEPSANRPGSNGNDGDLSPMYYQRYVRGVSCSAAYVAAAGRAVLLGVTRQLNGCDWAGSREFCYVGSIGPLFVGAKLEQQLLRLGDCLARDGHLSGVFGVDFVERQKTIWVLEVNPRYTASMEILERAGRLSIMTCHVLACESNLLPTTSRCDHAVIHGKAIIFADRPVTVGRRLLRCVDRVRACHDTVGVADVPPAGQQIPAGGPILTALAYARTVTGVRQRLYRMAKWFRGSTARQPLASGNRLRSAILSNPGETVIVHGTRDR